MFAAAVHYPYGSRVILLWLSIQPSLHYQVRPECESNPPSGFGLRRARLVFDQRARAARPIEGGKNRQRALLFDDEEKVLKSAVCLTLFSALC